MRSRRALRPAAMGITLIGLCGCRVLISAAPLSTDRTSAPTHQTAEWAGPKSWITRQRATTPANADPFLTIDDGQPPEFEQPRSAAIEHPPAEPTKRAESQPRLSRDTDNAWHKTRSQ